MNFCRFTNSGNLTNRYPKCWFKKVSHFNCGYLGYLYYVKFRGVTPIYWSGVLASPASQVLAESERNRADLAVVYGQHLNVNHQKPAVEMGFKNNFLETCYFNATGGRENVQNFGTLCHYSNIRHMCVCIMMALRSRGAFNSSLTFDPSPNQECLAKERHSHSQRENALKEVQADGWVVGVLLRLPRDPLLSQGLGVWRYGVGCFGEPGGSFLGLVMHWWQWLRR